RVPSYNTRQGPRPRSAADAARPSWRQRPGLKGLPARRASAFEPEQPGRVLAQHQLDIGVGDDLFLDGVAVSVFGLRLIFRPPHNSASDHRWGSARKNRLCFFADDHLLLTLPVRKEFDLDSALRERILRYRRLIPGEP